ncbi:glycosyltransferase family 25 protein [Allohahella marinimesophila]|uniref:Glycosyltransferase family 25 protein n=1 Tax=Allohahella marinimesophila TaxID=1054972 RepID=A0ABP7PMF9_9GAMM
MTADRPGQQTFSCQIITLDPTMERAQILRAELEAAGIEAEFFSAVDGRRGFPDLRPDERLDQDAAMHYRMTPLGSAEVGAYLSHFRAIKTAYDEGIEQLCLFEDDVHLEPAFHSVLTELRELPVDFEFIRFMALKRQPRKLVRGLAGSENSEQAYWLTRPLRGTLGGQGLLINRQGMEKLISYGRRIFMPIDKLYDHYWETGLHCFVVEPHIIWETAKPTTIPKPDFEPVTPRLRGKLNRTLIKMQRSVHRRLYLLKHREAFFPTSKKPPASIGRSPRIR